MTGWHHGLVAILLGLCAAASAAAADKPACDPPITVSLFEFGWFHAAATNDGVDSRLLDELEKRSGCRFQRSLRPRARIWLELQTGDLDLATAAIPTPEREAFARFIPYVVARNAALIHSASAGRVDSLADFESSPKLTLGVVRSFRHEAMFDGLIDRLRRVKRVVELPDSERLFAALRAGKIDALLAQPIVYRFYLPRQQLSESVSIRDWLAPGDGAIGGLALSRKRFDGDQAAIWTRLVAGIRADGTLREILMAFLTADEAQMVLDALPPQ